MVKDVLDTHYKSKFQDLFIVYSRNYFKIPTYNTTFL